MSASMQPAVAIVFACWHENATSDRGWPGMALVEPILNRSILQLVLERIVREKCDQVHLVLGEQPWLVRELLGNGERWGCQITYHYASADMCTGDFLARICPSQDRYYWVVDACSLPEWGWQGDVADGAVSQGYAGFWQDAGQMNWGGWACLRGDWLDANRFECSHAGMEAALLAEAGIYRCSVDVPIQVRGFADLLEAGEALLKDMGRYGLSGTLPQPLAGGVWVSRNCSIHEEAALIPPVFIGKGVKVEAGVTLGPEVVVGDESYIARGAQISHSNILSHSFVGEQTELRHMVVKGAHCHHAVYQTSIEIEDAGIIAPVDAPLSLGLVAWKSRLTALFLRICLAPAYGLLRILQSAPRQDSVVPFPHRSGEMQSVTLEGVATPVDDLGATGALLHHFVATFYPGLAAVARGHLDLVGPQIRCIGQVQALPPEWRAIYLKSRCGLLQEAMLAGSIGRSDDIQFMSDSFAGNVRPQFRRLLLRYLIALFRDVKNSVCIGYAVPDAKPDSRKTMQQLL